VGSPSGIGIAKLTTKQKGESLGEIVPGTTVKRHYGWRRRGEGCYGKGFLVEKI